LVTSRLNDTALQDGMLYRSTQWLHVAEDHMNPHHHENLSLPNHQYCHHHNHDQWHTVMVLLQRLEADCSGSCGTPQAGSTGGWEDQPNHSMQMSPTLCQRRKCRSHQFAASLAEEPNCLFAFWSLKHLEGNKCMYVAVCCSSSGQQTSRVLWKPKFLDRLQKSHPLVLILGHTGQVYRPTELFHWHWSVLRCSSVTQFDLPHQA